MGTLKVDTLVLPVAGAGKRLRPLTYRTPKNLIKVAGKPLVEYTLEEARAAGFDRIILIISPQHRAGFEEYVRKAKKRFPALSFHLRIQEEPFGNGHAILQAADLLARGPFAVRFPDDILFCERPVLSSLAELFAERRAPVLLLRRVPKKDVVRYGVVRAKAAGRAVHRIFDFMEKPPLREAPSNLTIVGGYVLTPTLLENLRELQKDVTLGPDALHLVGAFRMEVQKGRPFYGWEFPGDRLDCGTLGGLREAEEFFRKKRA